MLRIVIDTSVLVAALRSRRGASFELLSRVGAGDFEHCLSTPLLFEYEAVLMRQKSGFRISARAIRDILDYLCATARRETVHFLWRPVLKDPNDDMVLELAVVGECDHVVTFNLRDFVGSEKFGVTAITPQSCLEAVRRKR